MVERTCKGCGKRVDEVGEFCPACGIELPGDSVQGRSTEEREAARDWVTTANRIRHVRHAMRYLAVVSLLGAVVATVMNERLELPSALIAVWWAQTLFFGVAAIRVWRRPFAWTVSAALVWTLVVSSSFFLSGRLNGMSIAIAVLFWTVVAPAKRAGEALEAHPELLVPGRAAGTRTRALDRPTGSTGKGLLVAGAVMMLLLAGLAWSWISEAPAGPVKLEDFAREFEVRWNEGRFDDLPDLYGPKMTRFHHDAMMDEMRRRGWELAPPALPEVPIARPGRRAGRVDYPFGGRNLEVTWNRDDERRWRIADIALPGLEPARPLDPTLDRFIAAWNAGDSTTLGSFHHDPGQRRKAAANFAKLLSRYEQAEIELVVRSVKVHPRPDGIGLAFLEIGRGSLDLEWRWHHDGWRLYKVQAPR